MGKAKSTLKLYCNALGRLRHSKGFGIHSPFAFSFVLRVLREKCAYYAYSDIEERRRLAIRLVAEEEGEHPRIISQKNAKMLFRIACYFNPSNMVQIGTSYGVSTTAVLDVSSTSKLVIYKGASSHDKIYDAVTEGHARQIIAAGSIDDAFRIYAKLNSDNSGRPFLIVNSLDDEAAMADCVRHGREVLEREGVIVARNLLVSDLVVGFVREVTSELDYGMTFTNGRIVVIVGYKHLPRQRFNLWF